MKLLNKTKAMQYSSMIRATLKPGEKYGHITELKDLINKILHYHIAFILEKDDKEAIQKLLSMSEENEKFDPKTIPGYGDPTGEKRRLEAELKREKMIAEAKAAVKEEKEYVQRKINSESNFIAPDGNPIPKSSGTVTAQSTEINMQDGKPVSLQDAIAANKSVKRGRRKAEQTEKPEQTEQTVTADKSE